jgi:PPOX class probable F420-dependent enzyme
MPSSGAALSDDELWSAARERDQGILVTLGPGGRPQMSNVLFVAGEPDGSGAPERIVEVSTTAERQKARNVRRNGWAALHVGLGDFWAWAVLEGTASVTPPVTAVDDGLYLDLLQFYRRLYRSVDEASLGAELVADSRVLLRLRVERIYGLISRPRRDIADGT